MSADTKQTKAVAAANFALSVGQQLANIRDAINTFLVKNTNEGYTTTWSSFATCAQNADGSLGTADSTPNTAHPIDTRTAGLTGLANSVSETQLANVILTFQQLQNFFNGTAVTANTFGQFLDNVAN